MMTLDMKSTNMGQEGSILRYTVMDHDLEDRRKTLMELRLSANLNSNLNGEDALQISRLPKGKPTRCHEVIKLECLQSGEPVKCSSSSTLV